MKIKNLISIFAVLMLLASTATAQTSGSCGDNATWSFDTESQTLTISGTGNMTDYDDENSYPWYSIKENIKTVVINQGITSIGQYAFYKYTTITSVTIPGSIKTIDEAAFASCTNLTSVTISDGVESIGFAAFNYCLDITSLTIPESVKIIGDDAFNSCYYLKSVTIPENVETIGKHAFWFVHNIVYHGSLTPDNWGAYSLNGYIDGDFIYSDNTKKELRRYCGNDSEVEIPSGVTSIGPSAFNRPYEMSRVTSVIIPESVTSIGKNAFYCCGLTSLTIHKNVTSIGESAFVKNDNLKCVYFKNNPEKLEMGVGPFSLCSSVKCYVSPSTYDVWVDKFENNLGGSGAAAFCIEGEEFEQDGIVYILGIDGSAMVYNHTAELPNEIVIPSTITKGNAVYNVTTIGKEAFKDCENLTSVTIPQGVTTIGRSAFELCKNLVSVNIPQGVKKIGNSAFMHCNLASAFIPEGVTTIGDGAFYDNSFMTTLSIPESVTTIEQSAFSYVSRLNDVWWYASPEVFCGFYNPQKIHVPAESLDAFNEKYGSKYNFVGDIKKISNNDITIPAQTYTGTALTPVVKDGEKTLVEGEDYTITLSEGGCTNVGEYTVALQGKKFYYKKAEKTFTILPVPVTVTAEAKSKTFGESDPEFTATVTGLVNNDSPDLITYTLTRTEGENVGEYAITPKGDEKQGNYEVSFVDATLTINKATPNPEPQPEPEPDPQNPSTPVSSIDNGGNNVKVWSYARTIYIASTPDSQYKIIDLQGRTIKSATTKSSYEEVNINKLGILVVIINGKSYKVSL